MTPAPDAPGPRILVAPLDWGLGHATRCIPLVHHLRRRGATVLLAGAGKLAALLQKEFPDLPLLPLPGYDIRYPRSGRLMPLAMALQLPRIRRAIRHEHRWLQQAADAHRLDAIISDNRYGLCHPRLPSVLLTHQLQVQTGWGEAADRLLQRLHYRFLERFTACWVPDGAFRLAGRLSHPERMPKVPARYLGLLSRFAGGAAAEPGAHLLVLLSGPEPQRSLFEQTLLPQLADHAGPVILVRGLPGLEEALPLPAHIRVHNHLPAQALLSLLQEAEFVIARTGYSTVMDLAALSKKSILVPTPGQTEQVYLGRHLRRKGWALTMPQDRFRLSAALDLARSFPYRWPETNGHEMESVVDEFLEGLK